MKNAAAIFKLSYGMYIISSIDGDKKNAQFANTAFQITAEPAVIAVSINKQNYTHELIEASKKVGISVLTEDATFEFIGKYGFRCGRDFDKLADAAVIEGSTGVPIVTDYACAYIEGEVIQSADLGTHTVFFVKVKDADVLSDGTPMSYDYYHNVIKGKAPKSAPTYHED
ncbi:MAG: flavin reductase family protein [Clostridiales Family XIII bacterium]|jgi:ferric-chelate reductase [NAD(P)H]|nr:flavin reductase family protein [Clostridiales Family XIII bacterium]